MKGSPKITNLIFIYKPKTLIVGSHTMTTANQINLNYIRYNIVLCYLSKILFF